MTARGETGPRGPFDGPWEYDENGALIYLRGKPEARVADIRGYGYLHGKGLAALGLSPERAMEIQDQIGREIVASHNARIGRPA